MLVALHKHDEATDTPARLAARPSPQPSPRFPERKRGEGARTRAFTLIEVVLATALGTLVIAGAATVIGMLNRSDSMLRDRFDQTHDLAKTQIVLRRVFTTVVMSNEAKPAGYIASDARAVSEQVRQAAAARAASGQNDLPPARFILTPDSRFSGPGNGMALGNGDEATPQRLEMVVSQPPLVASLAPREVIENRDSANVVRGALEVRPSRTRAGVRCWSLWWVPLIETEEGWVPMRDSTGVVLGDKITDGLSGIRYTVFDDRVRKQEYSAIWYEELPAYVEIEVRTTAGLYANWMFDVAWFIGPDSPASTLPDEENTGTGTGTGGAGGGGGGGGGNGEGTGGPGRGGGGPGRGPGRGPGGGGGPGRGPGGQTPTTTTGPGGPPGGGS